MSRQWVGEVIYNLACVALFDYFFNFVELDSIVEVNFVIPDDDWMGYDTDSKGRKKDANFFLHINN